MQGKLIAGVHKARQRYEQLLRASEEALSRAVEVLEELGVIVLDDSVADARCAAIFARLPSTEISWLVDGCRTLHVSNEGSHLGIIQHWYTYTPEVFTRVHRADPVSVCRWFTDRTHGSLPQRSEPGREAETQCWRTD
jgi:hypothetical protein